MKILNPTDNSKTTSYMRTVFQLESKLEMFDMIHNSILEIPAVLKQAISCRPIGTIHNSPARSAGSGSGRWSRVLKGRFSVGTTAGTANRTTLT